VAERTREPLDRRWLLALLVLGVLTRVAWVLWVHPPEAHVRSDMGAYVGQAQDIARMGEVAARRLPGFRPFGTGWVLGAVLWLVGAENLRAAGVVQAVIAGLAPVLTALLGARVLPRPRLGLVAGAAVLLWFPGLSLTGYFLSEPWYTTLLLGSTLLLVRALQRERGALLGGLLAAIAFWVRPEVAALYGLAALAVAAGWRTLGARAPLRAAAFALPLLAGIGVGVVRHHEVTGRWGAVADSGALNLSMGRCHLIRLEAYGTPAKKRIADNGGKKQGWWIDLPGFRQLRARRGPEHVLGFKPSLGDWRISYVGRVDDPVALSTIRDRCLAADSPLEQARKSVVNAHLLWAMITPWPETDQEQGALRSLASAHLWAAIALWLLALPAGARWLRGARRHPARAAVAVGALSIVVLAAVVFGTPRLRTPYDPLAILLAVGTVAGGLRRQSSESPAAAAAAETSTTQS
jgi:hypothetical protein